MSNYPDVVAKIVSDYMERLKTQLRLVPVREQNEFLREIESHVYEAYQQTPGEDDVARILAVLRNLGEPAEVVSDRLPGTMVRSGTKRNLPLYIVGGILIALFGLPLGFGGLGVLLGLLGALTGVAVAFCATAGSILLVGALVTVLGLTRFLVPPVFDRLVDLGFIQLGGPVSEFLDHFSPSDQGLLMMLVGCVLLACGVGLLWLGRYLLRGLRFLFGLLFDRTRRLAQAARGKLRQENREAPDLSRENPKPAIHVASSAD
jgi:uncharacterized membrane protein